MPSSYQQEGSWNGWRVTQMVANFISTSLSLQAAESYQKAAFREQLPQGNKKEEATQYSGQLFFYFPGSVEPKQYRWTNVEKKPFLKLTWPYFTPIGKKKQKSEEDKSEKKEWNEKVK